MALGRLSPSVPIAQATVETIGAWMSGLWNEDVQEHLAQLDLADAQGGQHAQA